MFDAGEIAERLEDDSVVLVTESQCYSSFAGLVRG
jgi:hypothetical protein